ncbi:CbiX/SirB N-terminal domain-containing protein [Aquincola sp. S2]|uniref:CbiX/SirB N-terminal domain-containing protein n=1 Tax=Pseudaquabacterium terrae TaxID=2732868 RepID=A0ABX2EMG6_9BURK|nr:CbiX/SirB N-terminal domain-containing protein [Aquabacterium terrae]NRF69859.1 CbiX/SirB N-terminal domain-containing protein [Aquabacterium terrae]
MSVVEGGPRGLLLFAHGARDPAWARPFEAVAARCRAARPAMPVQLAFLDFMAPGLIEAGQRLAAEGCKSVDVLPLFLGAGGHVRKDVPVLLAQLEAELPKVRWLLHPAVGEAAALIEAMAAIALDAATLPVLNTR